MASVRQLTTLEQWEDALRGSETKPLVVFKHSTRCSVSAGAKEELQHFIEDADPSAADFAIVHVVEDRPVSNSIAERSGVTHASPQIILFRNGKPEWHTSHWNITYSFLSDKLGVVSASE